MLAGCHRTTRLAQRLSNLQPQRHATNDANAPIIFHFVLTDVNGVRLYATALRITDEYDITQLTEAVGSELAQAKQLERQSSASGTSTGEQVPLTDKASQRRQEHARIGFLLKQAFKASLDDTLASGNATRGNDNDNKDYDGNQGHKSQGHG